jgi:hypothetical protein
MPATTGNLPVIVFGFLIVVGGALVVGRACVRERRSGKASALLARLSHWKALAIGGAGLVALPYATFRTFSRMYMEGVPPTNMRYALAIGGVVTAFALTSWGLLWWRRRERARLGD